MKHITDVVFADEAKLKSEFAHGFAWGCATSAVVCLAIIAASALLGG